MNEYWVHTGAVLAGVTVGLALTGTICGLVAMLIERRDHETHN